MFTAAVALAVGAIPEGLPAAVTITLAIGVNRMALRAITDQIGTHVATDINPTLQWTLVAGAVCNDARLTHLDGAWGVVGDPTEAAMVEQKLRLVEALRAKFIVWTLPTNMGEGFVVLVAVMLGTALPIVPVQILWINMTTAVALGLMLAFEPKENGIMARPPRDPRTPLLTGTLLVRIILVSTLFVGGAWWPAFFTNRWILVGVTVQAIGQVATTYLPTMNTVFQTAPIGAGAWGRIFLFAGFATAVVATEKRLRLRHEQTSWSAEER